MVVFCGAFLLTFSEVTACFASSDALMRVTFVVVPEVFLLVATAIVVSQIKKPAVADCQVQYSYIKHPSQAWYSAAKTLRHSKKLSRASFSLVLSCYIVLVMLELSLLTIYIIITVITIYCAVKLMYAFRRFTMRTFTTPAARLSELPSVSVCIPARNETHAMTQCLESVVASTYPKLEIIVLDDASADNTSILIKSFAHAGVRFVEGSPLPGGWLGKNHALQGLLEEASGRYILYADVDTRLQPDTIGQLVAYAAREDAQMVSVLPQRTDGWRLSVLFSPLRYFWELVLHRQKAPATASSAWLIDRHALVENGGFSPIALDVQPEARLAATMALSDQYRFLISTPELGVAYEKKWSSQVETSIRLLSPRFGRTAWSAIPAAFLLIILWLPIPVVMSGLLYGWTIIQALALWKLSLFMALYALYASRIWRRHWWTALFLWPFTLTQEIILLLGSITGYARGTITWKGRPVRVRQAPSVVHPGTSEA